MKALLSFWLLMMLGALTWLFVLMTSIDGTGPNAIISIGNLSMPLRILTASLSIFELLLGLLIVIITLSLSDKVLSSQLACIYLARHQNRIQYFAGFFGVVLGLILISTSGYLYLYIKAGFNLYSILFAYSSKVFGGLALAVVLISITYFSRLKLVSIPLLVFVLFILPAIFRVLSGYTGNIPLLGDGVYFLEQLVSFYISLDTFRENIISRGFIQRELFFKGAIITSALIILNGILFNRKDFKHVN
ncbi:MAG: hypothetical protein JJU41_04285 [Bacteroidetes bacterium]|nr:hypothetical protein [Bacteroidota bacterium]MCH8523683.1 hypothetical protein [Balneolales bacterium]